MNFFWSRWSTLLNWFFSALRFLTHRFFTFFCLSGRFFELNLRIRLTTNLFGLLILVVVFVWRNLPITFRLAFRLVGFGNCCLFLVIVSHKRARSD